MFWFFLFYFHPRNFLYFCHCEFLFSLSPPHFSFLFSVPDPTSPLRFLFFHFVLLQSWLHLKEATSVAIIHAGHTCMFVEHIHTHKPPPPSNGSQRVLYGLYQFQHLCLETRTISIPHKQPNLELSHRSILCMHPEILQDIFSVCVHVYT